jgi:membrane protein YqaA with SNARE-associated domain
MRFATWLFGFVLKLGGPGLLFLGILDSSFLFAPWGNDLLVVVMTAQHPHSANMLYYAAMSAIGSVLGCLLVDITLRPLGEKGLEKHLPANRLKRVQKKIRDNGGRALAIASLVPPPFPFTAFVMAAAALQYPRKRLLGVVGVCRMARFILLGVLALRWGESILKWAKNSIVQGFLIGLIILCTVGSIVSVYGWIRRSKRSPGGRSSVPARTVAPANQ